jgi:ubiquinone/menaquinone biosynthesis C-methylase UbiE
VEFHFSRDNPRQARRGRFALKRTRAGFTSSIELQQEDLTRLTFRDASYRYVFSCGVITHIYNVEKALDELPRVIKPGGTLAVYVIQ